ncbi:hypothetical protein MATL_G00257090 [Megalops atlanticus]|uniref:GCM domain-containing protein n=1 Tax=Megalops atlanticus TaxID=7932 RepID=A0A9D3SUS1_MEGAT|nr:hypothetical protein MATL_G00257090 [Megalops atlanticus]
MSKSADLFDESDCVCSIGMKLTWDINDPKLPQDIKQFDAFQEWTDGYVRYIYNSEDKNAQRHLSGWAMRNTNNHNCQILKKSCLGVVVCGRNCTLPDGSKIQLRPAICDKARQKQQKKLCPSCNSPLELVQCRGHSGYPVTNFWRLDGKAIFFQSKGVHDHPRPESKSETEARRSAVKRRMSSPHFAPKKRQMESEAGRYHDPGGPFPNLHPLSCVESADRYGLLPDPGFPITQHYPSYQATEAYKFSYDSPGTEPIGALQKNANHRLYVPRPPCSYDFAVPGYLGSGSYTALYKDPGSPPTPDADPGKACAGAAGPQPGSLSAHSRGYEAPGKHQGWKQVLGKAGHGEQADYTQSPSSSGHHYCNGDYLCRYPGSSPGAAGATAPALQTIITTTTKVSYQPCKPSMVKYAEGPFDGKSTSGCSPLLEVGTPAGYPGVKVPEDSGVIKSALGHQPEALPPKTERTEGLDAYRYGGYPPFGYPERIVHPFKYEGGEY